MNIADQELIRQVAAFWVELGGDALGVEWCWRDLRDEVRRIESGQPEPPEDTEQT